VDSAELRTVQQPLKDAYREHPEQAVITLRADGRLGRAGWFRSIRLRFDLDTEASAEQVQTLVRLTERYCVVYQTLAHPAQLSVSVGDG
jgi:uncharacterized OsmC-like protein